MRCDWNLFALPTVHFVLFVSFSLLDRFSLVNPHSGLGIKLHPARHRAEGRDKMHCCLVWLGLDEIWPFLSDPLWSFFPSLLRIVAVKIFCSISSFLSHGWIKIKSYSICVIWERSFIWAERGTKYLQTATDYLLLHQS